MRRWVSIRRIAGCAPILAFVILLLPIPAVAVTVEQVVSPGGITAWLVRDRSIPITTIEFSFVGGAVTDPADKAGLAEMTASLLDEGAGEFDSLALQKRLDELSVRLSYSAGIETVRGSFKTLNRHREEAIELLRLTLTAPRFDPQDVTRIRSRMLASLSRRAADPRYIASRTWWRAAFGDHPYGRPVEGTPESIRAIQADDLRQFVANRFARDNLLVGVVGDITPQELAAVLDRAFGDLPAVADPPSVPAADIAGKGETYVVRFDIPQSVAIFGERGLTRDDPDYYVAQVLNYILGGGGFSSRLYEEVREKRGLAYSVGTSLNTLERGPTIMGSVGTNNLHLAESLALIRAEWARMRVEGASAEELAHAKQYLTGSFPLRLDSSNSIARMLVGMQYHNLGADYLERYADYIEAVGLEDVRRLAQRLLNPEALMVVVVGSPEGVEATAQAPDIGF